MAWKSISEEEKQQHPLYTKFTAYKLFMICMYISFVIVALASFGANFELERALLSISGTTFLEGELKSLYSLSCYVGYATLFISLIFLLCISNAGKTQKAFKLFIAFLVFNPIIQVVAAMILQSAFAAQGIPMDFISKSIAYIFLYVIIGSIFAVYCFFSKAYNLQFFSRVKV